MHKNLQIYVQNAQKSTEFQVAAALQGEDEGVGPVLRAEIK